MAKDEAKAKATAAAADEPFDFGEGLLEGLREVAAWKRGEIPLETRVVNPMPPERVKAIRKRVASSPAVFERRFLIPAATLNNWEQGRRTPDPAARLLLRMIDRRPDWVEQTAHEEAVAPDPAPKAGRRTLADVSLAIRPKPATGTRNLHSMGNARAAAVAANKAPAPRTGGRGRGGATK